MQQEMTTAEPADFDRFWHRLAAAAVKVDPAPVVRETEDPRVDEVRYTTLGGQRLGGWLVRPDGPMLSAVIVGHGYGGADAPDLRWVADDAVSFHPVARGLPALSLLDDVPSSAQEHVLHGIGSRDEYVHGGCAADMWCAVNALEKLIGAPLGERHGGLRLGYFGPSFGGGIGAMMLPWDDRFDAASLYVPSFGSHRDRLAVPCTGSGAALSDWVNEHPEAWDVLPYFDAATAARRIRIPTLVAPAHDDPAVPPVGQWAIARSVPSEHRVLHPMTAGHQTYPQEDVESASLAEATRALFARR